MKKIIYTLAFTAAATLSVHAQNVGVGTSTPNASAKLDVTSTNSGVLIPRVALTMTTAAGPVTSPANSLLVYNTATAGDVTPGFYYWSSTASAWIRIAEGKAGWEITGNTGIGAANFLGTINNADLMIRTNNTEKMRVLANGRVGINTTTPGALLDVNGGTWLRGLGTTAADQTFVMSNPGIAGSGGLIHTQINANTAGTLGFKEYTVNTGVPANSRLIWSTVDMSTPNTLTTNHMLVLHSQNNVGINVASADPSSQLEVASTTRGLLIPRVALTATNVAAPVTAPVTSLMVYNTATAGAGTTAVSPGHYYWDGTQWLRYAVGRAGWELLGNFATNSAINYLGTADAQDLVFRTNAIEKMRIEVGGDVGININNPSNKLDISAAPRSGAHGAGLPLYVTGTLGAGSAGSVGVEFRHDNGTQGIGFGFNTIYATGSNATQDLGLASRSTGNLNFTTNAAQRMIILGSNGNVGMGLTNPAYGLELNGSFGFGNGTPGAYRSRTETRDNAGQQATQSGFFETSAPVNYPAGAASWWHLIDSRHSNNGNNFALQIAGSFFDQELWFRKTNNNGAQAWSRLLSSTSGWTIVGNSGTNAGTNFVGTIDAVDFVTRTNNTEQMRVTTGGNVGIGIAGPTQRLDVQGGNARINNTFIGDVGHGAGWGGWSHSLQNNPTGYGLLQSNDGAFTLINKQNTGSGYIGFRVANTDQAVILNNGYMGVGITAPTARLHVQADENNLPVIYGRNTNNTAATTSFGVRGECGSTGLGSAGVSGVSTNSSQNEIGVVGDYALWGAGVFGLGWASAYADMPVSRDFGVFATCNFSTGTGVYARDMSNAAGSYAFYGTGKFSVTGAKAASVPTTQGNQLVYCTESPELWFEDLGQATLQNGSVHISLDDMFYETVFISTDHPMHVFLQEQGDCNGLYFVADADGKGFTVKEKQAGSSNVSFSYRIMAKRRFYQEHRFGVDSNQPFEDNLSKAKNVEPITTNPEVMRQWVEEQARMKESSVGYNKK